MSKSTRRSIKIPKIICGQCKLQVKEEEASIECDKCTKTFHDLCTTLDKREYDNLMNNDKEEYVCHICSESGGNIKSELNVIKTKLNKLDQLDVLQETMSFMSQQFDDILKGIAENKKKIDTVLKENKILKTEINDLKKTVKFLNDNRVKNDCLVSGVDVTDECTAVESVIKVMNNVGVTLKADEFEDAYFIGKKSKTNKQTVVAKFNSKASKQKIMSAKPKLNETEATKTVFVNDFLSKETLSLLNHARLLKSVGYRRVYSTGGKVFIKMSELSKPKLISSANEVDELLLGAATNISRRSQARTDVEKSDDSDGDVNSAYMSPS